MYGMLCIDTILALPHHGNLSIIICSALTGPKLCARPWRSGGMVV